MRLQVSRNLKKRYQGRESMFPIFFFLSLSVNRVSCILPIVAFQYEHPKFSDSLILSRFHSLSVDEFWHGYLCEGVTKVRLPI